MEREEFLTKLFSLYGGSFNKGNASEWINAYKQKLSDNIDFDNLYSDMLSQWEKASAPTPAFLSKIAKEKKNSNLGPNNKCEWNDTILADFGKITYEFALDCPFGIARTNLEKRGLTNIRLKEPIVRSFG